MRINHNIPALKANNQLSRTNKLLDASLERLSSGYRINSAADDAAGLAISEKMRTQISGLEQASRNASDGISVIQTAEGALIEVEAMLQRMRELSIQSANDALTSSERSYIQIEIDQLKEEMDRIVSGTQYNTQSLLDGSAPWGDGDGGILHIGPNSDDDADVIQYKIDSMDTASLSIDGDNLTLTSQSDATEAISSLDGALASVNALRADLGAMVNRLEHALTNQENQETNMQAAESVIRDADFAYETTQFTRNQIISQSSVAMLSQANMVPQSVLSLLQ